MRLRNPTRIPDVEALPADQLPLDYVDLPGYQATNREVKNGRMTIFVARVDALCSCGHREEYLKRHDTSRVDVWDRPRGMPTRLRITRRRLECLICGSTESVSLPEIDSDHFVTLRGNTWMLDQVAMWRPFSHVADAAGPSANTVKTLFLEDFQRLEKHCRIRLPRARYELLLSSLVSWASMIQAKAK
jgi:transposase